MRFRLSEGVRLEPLEETWGAFSPVSGDTLQLNTEAAAILELLAPGPLDETAICTALASDTDMDPGDLAELFRHVWDQLLSTGLVQVDASSAHNAG
jgi:PqqD family protein of HPr-rel-A system